MSENGLLLPIIFIVELVGTLQMQAKLQTSSEKNLVC